VTLPAVIAKRHDPAIRARARELLGRVGLADQMDHLPSELSGGQQQAERLKGGYRLRPEARHRSDRRWVSVLSLVLAVTALVPAAALAKNGADDNPNAGDDNGGQRVENAKGGGSDVKRVTGTCTGRSTSKLKAKPDHGRLETEFEVDQNRNGVTWKVRIRRNGKLAVKTNARTKAPSGSFSVERRLTNGSGSDRITARATSPSGEVCKASITI